MLQVFSKVWIDDRHPPRREIVARLLLAVLGIATCILALTARQTFTHAMLSVGGELARVCILLTGFFSILLLVDTIINDLLPARFSFPISRAVRQHLWTASSLLFALFAYIVFTAGLSTSLGTYLVIYGVGCMALAFIDAAALKVTEPRQCRA